MKPYRWKTIWTGSATTGNTISTGVNFNNIKRIRFKEDKSNVWHEANISDFLNGKSCAWSVVYNQSDFSVDVCIRMDYDHVYRISREYFK